MFVSVLRPLLPAHPWTGAALRALGPAVALSLLLGGCQEPPGEPQGEAVALVRPLKERTEPLQERAALPEGGAALAPASAPEVAVAPAPPAPPPGDAAAPPAPSAPSALLPPTPDLPSISDAAQAAYYAPVAKSVVDLQRLRTETALTRPVPDAAPARITLLNLAPQVGRWHVLKIEGLSSALNGQWHLEVRDPKAGIPRLDPTYTEGVVFTGPKGPERCPLWLGETPPLLTARSNQRSFGALCEGRMALRNPTEGNKTTMEWTTDFLRTYVWGGEQITSFVKETFFEDKFLSTSEVERAADGLKRERPKGAPAPAQLAPAKVNSLLTPTHLGLALADPSAKQLLAGRWYRVKAHTDIYASALMAKLIDPALLAVKRGSIQPMDDVEAGALAYLVAFDLAAFNLHFALGTDHPGVGWSPRYPEAQRPRDMLGPDGFDTIAPLERVGKVDPVDVKKVVGTFTGGFKRSHGSFKSGELSKVNSGSHYGFIEEGVILSKLQPGLATLTISVDGRLDLKTWTLADNANLSQLRYARQNGVPILERDPETGQGVPGALVGKWGEGNWSGSVEGNLRSVRGAVCLQESDAGRFLLYGYFSSHTPSAMARIFQAYGCQYAMLTDMNALEHTYLSLLTQGKSGVTVEHLVQGMEVLDKSQGGAVLPRFVAFADNRDFFYLSRKEDTP